MKNNKLIIGLVLLLISTPFANSEEPEFQPASAGAALGGVVVVGGGLFVYWLIKKCQQWFPEDPTTATNNPVINQPPGYAAAYIWEDDSGCAFQPASLGTITHVQLDILGDHMNISRPLVSSSEEFWGQMASYGLKMASGTSGDPAITFPVAREPVVELPFEDWQVVSLERSHDLATWQRILTTRVPPDGPWRVYLTEDLTQTFYRLNYAPLDN